MVDWCRSLSLWTCHVACISYWNVFLLTLMSYFVVWNLVPCATIARSVFCLFMTLHSFIAFLWLTSQVCCHLLHFLKKNQHQQALVKIHKKHFGEDTPN